MYTQNIHDKMCQYNTFIIADLSNIFYSHINFVFIYLTDLSFNNIEVIEGLDTLVKLRDLTLFNNRITRIENMDTLVNLHVLSIGNNNIKGLENVSKIVLLPYDFSVLWKTTCIFL